MTLNSSPGYLRVVRASAWYDVAATAAFATPWTFAWLRGQLNALAPVLGVAPVPVFDPTQLLFANLMGSVVLVWAAVRLWRTQAEFGVFDGIARVLFAVWQFYAIQGGASALIWPFLVAEVGFGVAQLLPVGRGVVLRRR